MNAVMRAVVKARLIFSFWNSETLLDYSDATGCFIIIIIIHFTSHDLIAVVLKKNLQPNRIRDRAIGIESVVNKTFRGCVKSFRAIYLLSLRSQTSQTMAIKLPRLRCQGEVEPTWQNGSEVIPGDHSS